jgi:hypothetical protein
MLDYDRLTNLVFCLGLFALFLVAFNAESVLAAIRRLTHSLTAIEHAPFRVTRHRRKARRV